MDDSSQIGCTLDEIVRFEPITQRFRCRLNRKAGEENILIAGAGVGPGDVDGVICNRQTVIPKGHCSIKLWFPGQEIKRLVGDTEIGAECDSSVGTHRAEDVEQPQVVRVAAGVVPNDGQVARLVRSQNWERLTGNYLIGIVAGRALAAVVVVERQVGVAAGAVAGEVGFPGRTMIGGPGEEDVGKVDDASWSANRDCLDDIHMSGSYRIGDDLPCGVRDEGVVGPTDLAGIGKQPRTEGNPQLIATIRPGETRTAVDGMENRKRLHAQVLT